MDLLEFFSRQPGAVYEFIGNSGGIPVVLLDGSKSILDCSPGFSRMLSLREKPVGADIGRYIDGEGLELPPAGSSRRMSLDFMGAGPVTAHAHGTADGCVIFCERPGGLGATSDQEAADLARELAKARAEIARMMDTDALTGLANSKYFTEILAKAVSFARRSGLPLSLIMIDLDNFKFINDTYGHEVRDRVLVSFSELLSSTSRAEDTAARLGSDEFLLLLPNTDTAAASSCAERMREAMKGLVVKGVTAKLSASFGVTELREEDSADTFLKRADDALFRAKGGGPRKIAAV